MILPIIKIYDGVDLSGSTNGVAYIPILTAGTITTVQIKTDIAVSGANAVFRMKKNGVVEASAAATITIGNKIVTVSGLSIAVAIGDEIVFDLVSGAVSSPVACSVSVDDGELSTSGAYEIVGDDFGDGTISAALWATPDAAVSETGGRINITSATTKHLKTLTALDLYERRVSVEIVSPDMSSNQVATSLLLAQSDAFSSFWQIQLSNNLLECFNSSGGAVKSVAYDPVKHKFIAMRLLGTVLLYQTSPDGLQWTTLFSSALASPSSFVALFVYLRMYNGTGANKTALYDNFSLRDFS
jgi:hypothetical protein